MHTIHRSVLKVFFFSFLLLLCSCAKKGEGVTFQNEGNPLIRSCYTADPAPVVFDGRLYLYTGHDECFEDSVGYEGLYGFNITNWLCFSTDDMQTWTEHGVVLIAGDHGASARADRRHAHRLARRRRAAARDERARQDVEEGRAARGAANELSSRIHDWLVPFHVRKRS